MTAVYSSLVMITQNNIKAKLALNHSQMGVAICLRFRAYSIALFHIIAHSFYRPMLYPLGSHRRKQEGSFKLRPTTPQEL